MRTVKILSTLFVSGLFTLSASTSVQAKMVKKTAVPIIGDVSTLTPGDGSGEKGDFILEQRFVAAETARLAEPFSLSRAKFDAKHDIPADALLYKIQFQKDKFGYCTFDKTFSQQPKIGKLWTAQSCFSDEDGDGALDREFSAQKDGSTFPRLSVNLLWSDEIEFPPLSIIKGAHDPAAGVNAKIRIAKLSPKKVKFELHLQTDEGEFTSHATQTVKLAKDGSLPQTVDVFGAKLQINSASKEVLNYSVLSGFSETREIALLRMMSLDDMFEVFFLDEWEY